MTTAEDLHLGAGGGDGCWGTRTGVDRGRGVSASGGADDLFRFGRLLNRLDCRFVGARVTFTRVTVYVGVV